MDYEQAYKIKLIEKDALTQHAVEVVMLSTKIRKHKINTQESVNSVLRRLLS